METKQAPGPQKWIQEWIKENWTVGQYTLSEEFKKIENHSCVCRKDDMGLIAITGPAEDLESQKLSDLIAAAPELLEALRELGNAADKYFHQDSALAEAYRKGLSAIAKAEGRAE